MARSARSKILRKSGKRHVVPKDSPKPDEPINDTGAKFEGGTDVMIMPNGEGDEREFTVSPFRMLLQYRPRKGEHVPTEKTRRAVMSGLGLGLSQQAVADFLGINVSTLANHYEEEIKISRHLLMHDIKTNLYNVARDPTHKQSVQAGIFLLSKLGGEEFRDKKSVELTGKDGKPLQIDQRTQTIDPSLLNHEQRDALREILTSAMKLAQSPQQLESRAIDGDYEEVSNGE